MRCSECQQEMVQSKVGWLCANCGHTENVKPSEVALTPPAETKAAQTEKPQTETEEPPAVSASATATEPTTTPETGVTTKSAPDAPVGDVQPAPAVTAPKTLAPVTPETHPHPRAGRWTLLVVALAIILGGVGYWLFMTSGSPLSHPVVNTPVPAPTPEVSDSPSPSSSPVVSPSPAASVAPGTAADATARDNQRQTDLASYVTAYRAQAVNGFYPVQPPAVAVAAKDPTTNAAYVVQTAAVSGLGQIYYHAGGQCGGPGITPGATGTRYVSLTLQLEAGNQPYCLDVK